jgi:sugar lactone lactonase YvrE
MTAPVFFNAEDIVGESIVYDPTRNALVWVDIGGKRIHRLFLADKRHECWGTPDFPASIGLRKDGGAIVGLRDRVALWDFAGEFHTLALIEPDLPENRLNEGRVGPDGAFWVGTMQNNLNPDGSSREITRSSGAIYRVAPDGHTTRLTPREFGIANTMAWTNDGRFICADTLRNEIYAFNYRDGALADKRLFSQTYARGLPDGSCLDVNDHLWNCRVVAALVSRVSDRMVSLIG